MTLHYFNTTGEYCIASKCKHCGEVFAAPALSNYSPYCFACRYAFDREHRYQTWLEAPPTFWPYGETR